MNPMERRILELCQQNPALDRLTIAQLLEVSPADLDKPLTALRDRRWLLLTGRGGLAPTYAPPPLLGRVAEMVLQRVTEAWEANGPLQPADLDRHFGRAEARASMAQLRELGLIHDPGALPPTPWGLAALRRSEGHSPET